MKNEKFIKSSVVIDKILKIIQGFVIAGIIVAAVFIPLTAIFGEKVIADASTLAWDGLKIELAGDYLNYLNIPEVKISIIVTLITAIIALAVAWLCIKKLREILSPMKEGRPFEAGISQKIRRLGLIILIGGAVTEVCRAVGSIFESKAYNLDMLFNNTAIEHVSSNFEISLWFVVAALILFFLSYIFRYGEELQRESDETL